MCAAADWKNGIYFPVSGGNFSFRHHFPSGYGVHPASYTTGREHSNLGSCNSVYQQRKVPYSMCVKVSAETLMYCKIRTLLFLLLSKFRF